MSRVYDAFRRAAEEQKKESAARLQDHGGVDTVTESFPAEVPFERLAFTGQKMTRDKSSPPLLLGVAQGAAPDAVAEVVSDRPAPSPEGKANAASAQVSGGPQAATEPTDLTQEVRKRAGGSFEDLLRDIARDERRMNL